MRIGDRIFVQCECRGPSHIMEVELGGSANSPEMTIWYMLNRRLPLHKRLVTAALYVLNRESWRTARWLDFDEFHLNAEGVAQLRDACDTYLETWRRRVSKEEFGRRLRDMAKRSQKEHLLADGWAEVLGAKLGRSTQEIEEKGLRADDFLPHSFVTLEFADGSIATFENAFATENNGEVAVFTEHCGYHVFSRDGVVSVGTERGAP